jgi:hypothetical protein
VHELQGVLPEPFDRVGHEPQRGILARFESSLALVERSRPCRVGDDPAGRESGGPDSALGGRVRAQALAQQ